jgi:hypothetical protein
MASIHPGSLILTCIMGKFVEAVPMPLAVFKVSNVIGTIRPDKMALAASFIILKFSFIDTTVAPLILSLSVSLIEFIETFETITVRKCSLSPAVPTSMTPVSIIRATVILI